MTSSEVLLVLSGFVLSVPLIAVANTSGYEEGYGNALKTMRSIMGKRPWSWVDGKLSPYEEKDESDLRRMCRDLYMWMGKDRCLYCDEPCERLGEEPPVCELAERMRRNGVSV